MRQRIIDFRPAPEGWHIVHLNTDTAEWSRYALVGWLIQEDEEGHRSVVAGEVDGDGEIRAAIMGLWNVSAWYVAGPGDPDPTREEVEQELASRQERRRKHLASREPNR